MEGCCFGDFRLVAVTRRDGLSLRGSAHVDGAVVGC
jgi:hypothetical protein